MISTSVFSSEFNYTGPELKMDYSGPIIIHNSHFKYTASDRLTFYTEDYLKHYMPNLLPLRKTIDTWAAMLSIHPRLLSGVMQNYFKGKTIDNSIETKQKIYQISTGLSQAFNLQKDDILSASKAVSAIAIAYGFDLNLDSQFSTQRVIAKNDYFRGSSGPPLYSYLRPPWPQGEFWSGGGVHSNSGSGSSPRNSLDFFKSFISWGGDTSDIWVTASNAGIARVISSCYVQVIHPNGWVSSYYHLDNIQVNDMDNIVDNQRLSNYADNLAQATCQGGSSTGPHVHFSISYDGTPIEIDEPNVDFTSWKHQAGIGQYDSNCANSIYTMIPGGETVCPFRRDLPNNVIETLLFANSFE